MLPLYSKIVQVRLFYLTFDEHIDTSTFCIIMFIYHNHRNMVKNKQNLKQGSNLILKF